MPEEIPAPAKNPATFRELALTVATQLYLDIHVNLSGLVLFSALAFSVLHPEVKEQCQDIVTLAATYLFSSAKRK